MKAQATLANWREALHNRWAFHHVRELIQSAEIANDPRRVRELPVQPRELDVAQFLAETQSDGFVVLHRGALLAEHYAHGMSAASRHILMSVSKSMLGLLFGSLGVDAERQVTDFVPEIANTAYQGATVRQLLDMRTGVAFVEDYLASSGPIVEYRKATGWNPLGPGDTPSDLHAFYQHLTQRDGAHGGRFHYISPNTDLLGWVIERATGRRYADLMSEYVWRPSGAEESAYITVDRLGAPRTAGGMCVTARDLARVGQWMIEQPSAWVRDIESAGDRAAWDAGSFAAYFPGMAMRYRNQWYILEEAAPLIFGYGIHGQWLFVDRRNQVVIAKLSSQALPMDAARIALTMRAVSQLRKCLA